MPRVQIPVLSDVGFYTVEDIPVIDQTGYASFLNGYFEKAPDSLVNAQNGNRRMAFVKRPGVQYTLTSGFSGGHKIQGMISNIGRTNLFIYTNNGIVNTTWFWNGSTLTNNGTAPAVAGSWTLTGPVVFTQLDGISYGSTNFAAVTDFTKGAVVSSTGVWTEITDTDFIVLNKATNFVALDGYLFIGTTNNRIYNSDLNTPSSWVSTSFLTAADTPGSLLWLSRIRNMIVAFKDKSIEFFEDVGNPTPGSPLEPRRQYNRTIGCINRSTIKEMADGIIFAGAAENATVKMYKLSKTDLSITEISNRYVEQCLANGYKTAYGVDQTVDGSLGGQSQAFSLGGKEFYIIALHDPNLPNSFTQASLVYDNSLGTWSMWQSSFTNGGDSLGFVPSQAQMLQNSASGVSSVGAAFAVNNLNPPRVMIMDSLIQKSSGAGLYTDGVSGSGHPYLYKWTSDLCDFGSRKRKFMDALEIIYEGYGYGGFDNPFLNQYTMTLSYRNYDFNATSSYKVDKTVSYDTGGGLRAVAKQLGSFRRRVFQVSQTQDTAFKIWGLEADINEGETDEGGG